MDTVQFENGDQMPTFGLGTWKSNPGEVHAAVKEALRLGYRHIDCAAVYGNEAEIGQALTEAFNEGIVKREDLWITSKLWNNAHGAADVEPAFMKTLQDLQLDYLDLYLIHWPVVIRSGLAAHSSADDLLSLEQVPTIETWTAMEALVEKGLCRQLGVSNFSVKKLDELVKKAKIKPVMNQVELHPYLQQPKMLEFCKANSISLTAYAPLGSSDRPERLKTADEPVLLEEPTIQKIANKYGVSSAQVLLAWALQRGTLVIPKSVTPARIKQNLDAVAVKLSEQDMEDIAALDRHRRYVSGNFWIFEGGPYTMENIWDE